MIYNAPTKGEDGLYFVKALNDEKRKCFVQLNKVKVTDVSGEIVIDIVSEANTKKVEGVDAQNLVAALENSGRPSRILRPGLVRSLLKVSSRVPTLPTLVVA